MSRHRSRLALAAILLIVAGCRQTPPATKPLVIASVYPLWEFSRRVAGDRAEVVSMVPPGVEPHDWEPSPRDVVQVQKARAFVYSGTGLEPWAEKVVAGLAGKGTVVVNASKGISLLTSGTAADPHVWLDPVLARSQVEAIAAGLEQADPAGRAVYAANAQAFVEELDALDRAFAAGLRDCARHEVVTSHTAFAYLTRRYRLTQVPVMGLAPESEPSPADLAAIVKTARRLQVTHIFFEPLVSSRLAETLSRETGAKTLVLDPIEGVTKDEAGARTGYLDLMRANLANLRTALGCR